MSRSRNLSIAAGILLVLLYALPLFVPPAAIWPGPPAADAGLWARIFPGVATWWVVGRLACLLAGASLIAIDLRVRLPLALSAAETISAAPPPLPKAKRAARWAALGAAALHATAGPFASQFSRLGETAYFTFLAVPASLFAWAETVDAGSALRGLAPRLALLLIVPLLWLAVAAPSAWRSPRAANLVDMWALIERLDTVALGHQQMLADSAQPGHTNAYMMLEGMPVLAAGTSVSFVGLQVAHALSAVLCALIAGALVWQVVGRAAAPVAQSALLFSQYGLSALYEPAPMLFTALCTAALLLLMVTFRRHRSGAALIGFGAVAGISTTDPPLWLITLLLSLVMAYWIVRCRPFPWLAVIVAGLASAAAMLPSIPTPATLAEMARQYTFGRAQLAGIVSVLYGQQSAFDVGEALSAGRPGMLDIPLGAFLAPFAIPRTPLRLWGDALLEPFAAMLLAIGLLLCLRDVLRNRDALLVLALFVAVMAQGFTAQGDAVSHTRLAPALIPIVILVGAGFEALRRAFAAAAPPTVVAAVVTALVAMSGWMLFEKVTPTIEPSSALAISLEAIGAHHSNADPVFLDHGDPRDVLRDAADPRRLPNNVRWLYVEPIARLLPARPVPTQSVAELRRGVDATAGAAERIYFWSPGLEADAAVMRTICARWPAAALYTLWDRPRIFRALAAAPRGAFWTPRLPAERWTVTGCPPSPG